MTSNNKFTDLEIWQAANELGNKLFSILNLVSFTNEPAIKDQMTISVGAIADHIAAGFGCDNKFEFIRFLGLSKASAAELQSQIIRCYNRNYISKEIQDKLIASTDDVTTKMDAFIKELDFTLQEDDVTRNHNPGSRKPGKEYVVSPEAVISTLQAAKPLGAYPHARKAGNLLFLSGIGSRQAIDNKIPGLVLDTDGKIIKYDIEAECHAVFANVKAVLEASGSCWENMIDVTVFLTNMKKDFEIYNKIYCKYFQGINACRTTVEVKSLPTPIAIELKVIATL